MNGQLAAWLSAIPASHVPFTNFDMEIPMARPVMSDAMKAAEAAEREAETTRAAALVTWRKAQAALRASYDIQAPMSVLEIATANEFEARRAYARSVKVKQAAMTATDAIIDKESGR